MRDFSFATQTIDINIFLVSRQFYQESSALFYRKTVLKLFYRVGTTPLDESVHRGASLAEYNLRSREIFRLNEIQAFPPEILSRFRRVELHYSLGKLMSTEPGAPLGKSLWRKAKYQIKKVTESIAKHTLPGSTEPMLDVYFWESKFLDRGMPQ